MSNKGKFIVIDGPDGVGKSAIIRELKLYFNSFAKCNLAYLYDQYTVDDVCADIKKIIINNGSELDSNTLALLSMAARTILDKEIKQYIDDGFNVICDRYISSTVTLNADSINDVYNIKLASELMKAYIKPDLYIILRYADLNQAKEPEDSMEEKITPKKQQSRFEKLSNILDNICYVDIDHNDSIFKNVCKVLTKLLIFEEFRSSITENNINEYLRYTSSDE